MVRGREAKPGAEKPIGTLITELVDMIVAYVKQETLAPIRSLPRYIAYGVAGAMMFALGGVLLTLAVIRATQTEAGAHLGGDLTWVPYIPGILLAALGAAWAISRVGRGRE
jgi:hypothetical protein